MNLTRLKYIIQSELIFLPLILIAKYLTFILFQKSEEEQFIFAINFIESLYLAGIFATVMSISAKVIDRFTDDIASLRFNFTLVSAYIFAHYLISFSLIEYSQIRDYHAYTAVFISILIVAVIISNLKFKKVLNDKK